MEDEDEDWVDDETYARRVREGGRLENVRRAVEPTHCEAVEAPDPAIRIRYRQAGTVQGPNDPLAEVVVSEGFDVVAVTLFERMVSGVFPDGTEASEKLAAVTSFVEIGLQRPLGARPVIDGATGRRLEPLELDPAADERRRYGPAGCPRWV